MRYPPSRHRGIFLASLLAAASVAATVPAHAEAPGQSGEPLVDAALEARTGDLDAIVERGYLRMAVPPDPLMLAYDGERAMGLAVEIARELEKHLAGLPGASANATLVVLTPTPRAELEERVVAGRSDFTTLTNRRAGTAGGGYGESRVIKCRTDSRYSGNRPRRCARPGRSGAGGSSHRSRRSR